MRGSLLNVGGLLGYANLSLGAFHGFHTLLIGNAHGLFNEGFHDLVFRHGANDLALNKDLPLAIAGSNAEVSIACLTRAVDHAAHDGHAQRDGHALESGGHLVGVWPEGFKGVGKPFSERYKLQRFGRGGFVSTAVASGAPIIPLSVVGSEEIYPKIGDLGPLARLLGLPYFPITPTWPLLGPLGLVPLPSK